MSFYLHVKERPAIFSAGRPVPADALVGVSAIAEGLRVPLLSWLRTMLFA